MRLHQITCLVSVFIFGQLTALQHAIIPKPQSIIELPGFFELSDQVTISVKKSGPIDQDLQGGWMFYDLYDPRQDPDLSGLLSYMTDFFVHSLDVAASINQEAASANGAISIMVDYSLGIPDEGYVLEITPENITMRASTAVGAFWAFQTLRQLIPFKNKNEGATEKGAVLVPCVKITDAPRFGYRGLMLDVSRHMFSVESIKKYIDVMALYKLNTFHWHLTDDQGWRIEIKGYPRLQEIAAYRDETLIGHRYSAPQVFDGTRYGGYYTQEEIKEVVEYARQRHITVVPEIEMPGHCVAALAAYPELGCTGGPYTTRTKWGAGEDVYCAGNEKTFSFLEDVLTQVMDLFPDTSIIHIGGDQVPKDRWHECLKCQERMKNENLRDEQELQSYFIQRIEKFVINNGRLIVGWDEILEGGLASDAIVMSWRGIEGGVKAARLHHPVIMTPRPPLYFDYYQSHSPDEPLAIRGYILLRDVYDYDPVPQELDAQEGEYIQGVQANVWTEYIKTAAHAEYMTYPRALALAEIAWTQPELKSYDDFVTRVESHTAFLKTIGVNCAKF